MYKSTARVRLYVEIELNSCSNTSFTLKKMYTGTPRREFLESRKALDSFYGNVGHTYGQYNDNGTDLRSI